MAVAPSAGPAPWISAAWTSGYQPDFRPGMATLQLTAASIPGPEVKISVQ